MMRVCRFLARFRRCEEGSLAIETMIIITGLWLAFLVMVSVFDIYQQNSANQKATYAVSDLVSRQTDPIDVAFLQGSNELFDTLARAPRGSAVRLTSVKWDEAEAKFILDWSQSNGYQPAATPADVAGWADRLPELPDQEHIMIVETWSQFDAPFNVQFDVAELHTFVFAHPRYAPRVCWQACS